jgi:uncharacterized protein
VIDITLLDVSIPMCAAGGDHPYKAPCIRVLSAVARGRLRVAIDSETIQEILYRFGHLQRWETGATMAESLLELAAVVHPVTAADAALAVELFREHGPRGVPARDFIHCAVARNNGIGAIISTDRHFDLVDGIERLDPQTISKALSAEHDDS